MRVGLALSVLIAAFVSGLCAAAMVLLQWVGTTGAADATRPALWAARTFVAYFDVGALVSFVPSLTFCRWLCRRLDPPASVWVKTD